MPNQITSWSISRLNTYRQCPAKLKYSAIDKLSEAKSDAMARGTDIHTLAEKYVKGETSCIVGGVEERGKVIGGTTRSLRTFPKELAAHTGLVKRLRAKYKADPESMVVESMWVFKKDWSGTVWNDWNGAWLRVKLDVAERTGDEVDVWDWKSGKYRPDSVAEYEDQMDLYGLAGLLVFSGIGPKLRLRPRLVYTDAGVVHPAPGFETVYEPKQIPALKKKWVKAVTPMLNDRTFAPKPNRFCPWCAFRKEAGGPCKF